MAASFFSQRYVLPEGHAWVPVRLINLGVESIECGRRKRRMRQEMGREEKEERSSLDIKKCCVYRGDDPTASSLFHRIPGPSQLQV